MNINWLKFFNNTYYENFYNILLKYMSKNELNQIINKDGFLLYYKDKHVDRYIVIGKDKITNKLYIAYLYENIIDQISIVDENWFIDVMKEYNKKLLDENIIIDNNRLILQRVNDSYIHSKIDALKWK